MNRLTKNEHVVRRTATPSLAMNLWQCDVEGQLFNKDSFSIKTATSDSISVGRKAAARSRLIPKSLNYFPVH